MATRRAAQVPGASTDEASQAAASPDGEGDTSGVADAGTQAPAVDAAAPTVARERGDVAAAATTTPLRAHQVDPTKLKRAVLTADGWVCPATSPAPLAKE